MFKIKPLFRKGIKAKAKNYRSIYPSPLISKLIVKQFAVKPRIIFKEMNYSTVIN